MRNKKSVLMTLKVNYGYFSGVGGIAGNVLGLCVVGELTHKSSIVVIMLNKSTNDK